MSFALLVIAAAWAVAAGEAAQEELRLATVAIGATPPTHGICSADPARDGGMPAPAPARAPVAACASAHAQGSRLAGAC